MKTTITSHIYIENPTEEIKEWCQNNLVLSNPVYELYKRQGKNYLLKSKHITEKIKIFYLRYNTIVLPFGCLKSIWNLIKDFPYTTSFNENECISIKDEQPKEKLFDYQEKALKVLIESKGGVLKAPCGSGKTYIGIELIRRLGKKTLWLCHTSDLLNQTKKKMLAQYPNIKIGITTAGNLEIGEDITIATVQTLSKINPEFYKNEFDVIVCDEAAHVVSEPTNMRMFGEVLSNVPARYKFGLTATPNRSDGMIK